MQSADGAYSSLRNVLSPLLLSRSRRQFVALNFDSHLPGNMIS